MRFACWIPKATNTHTHNTKFTLLSRCNCGASNLRYMSIVSTGLAINGDTVIVLLLKILYVLSTGEAVFNNIFNYVTSIATPSLYNL